MEKEKEVLTLLSIETLEQLHNATTTAVNEIQELIPEQRARYYSETYITLMALQCSIFQILRERLLHDGK